MDTSSVAIVLVAIAALFAGLGVLVRPGKRRAMVVLCGLCALGAIAAVVVSGLIVQPEALATPVEPSMPASAPPPTPTPTPRTPSVVATEVRQLNVVNPDGTLDDDYEVDETVEGTCDDGSDALYENPNAFRCFAESDSGSFVADPCLALADGVSVYCLSAPWNRTGTQIDLDDPVAYDFSPRPLDLDEEDPFAWAIEIVDPRHPEQPWRCLIETGASNAIAGNNSSYWCVHADGSGESEALNTLAIGDRLVWKILFYDPDEPDLIEADVVRAWI